MGVPPLKMTKNAFFEGKKGDKIFRRFALGVEKIFPVLRTGGGVPPTPGLKGGPPGCTLLGLHHSLAQTHAPFGARSLTSFFPSSIGGSRAWVLEMPFIHLRCLLIAEGMLPVLH